MDYNDEIKDLLQKIEPLDSEKSKALWLIHLLSKDKMAFYNNRNLLRLLSDRIAKNNYQNKILLPPPVNKSNLTGVYRLGEVIYPESTYSPFGLTPEDFIKHILITGITGAGKTNLSHLILKQLAGNKQPFIVFDWKRSYRKLRVLPEFKNLKVIRLGETKFKFNPLIPPQKTMPKHWLTMITDIIKHSFFVAHGVEYFFRNGIDSLYESFKVYEGNRYYPTFKDLERVLKREFVRGREMLWMSSVKRVLSILTFSGMLGDIVDTNEPTDLESLLDQQVVFEMDNLSTVEKIFFVEAFLLWIYQHKKEDGKNEIHNLTLVIEEAHHILSGKKEYEQGEETIVESLIRMIREFGVGIIAIDQEPAKLSQSILANTNTKITFTLGNGKDIDTIFKSTSLRPEQRYFIDQLQVGHAIIKSKNRYIEPIHVRFPLMKINEEYLPIGSP